MAIGFDVFGIGDSLFEGLFGGALCGRCVFWRFAGVGYRLWVAVVVSKSVVASHGAWIGILPWKYRREEESLREDL